MTTPAEDALYASLTDIEDLERLSRIGLDLEAIPTEEMRPIVQWAIDAYFESGRRVAPSRELLLANWGQEIEDAGVELLDENLERDTIETAIEHLNGIYAERQFQTFLKEAATLMATVSNVEKVDAMTVLTEQLFAINQSLQDHTNVVEARTGLPDSLTSYEDREASGQSIMGLTIGDHQWDPVNIHMGGIRDGELAVLAAGPKVGKSYLLCIAALHEWQRGRRTVLFSLENSVEMTYDRILCLGAKISPRRYQRGILIPEEKDLIEKFLTEHGDDMRHSLHVIAPPEKQRTPEMMIRQAHMLDADSVMVDQLTHVHHPDPGRKPRHELFNENVHQFKTLISTGREKVPLLLAHQINREGVKAAQKVGYHEMYHLAESAGVERAADWVLSLYQGKADRRSRKALFQILAGRREDTKNWNLFWSVDTGGNEVKAEVSLGL